MIDVLTGMLGTMLCVGGYQLVAENAGADPAPVTDHPPGSRWALSRQHGADLFVVVGLAVLEVLAAASVVVIWNGPFPVAFKGIAVATLVVGTALVWPAQARRLERARPGSTR